MSPGSDLRTLDKLCHHVYVQDYCDVGSNFTSMTVINFSYCILLVTNVAQALSESMVDVQGGFFFFCLQAEPCLCPLSPQGFGSVTAEHWLGNEYVYQLTSQRQHTLRVELTDWEGHQAFSLYDRFQIGSEKQNYR